MSENPKPGAGFRIMAYLGGTLGSNMEMDYFLFVLTAILWAAVPSAWAGKQRGTAYVVGLATIGFASVAFGFLFLWLLDRIVPPLGPLFLLHFGAISTRSHLAAVGAGAIAFFLLLWRSINSWARRGSDKAVIYADGYLACRRELKSLSRKWQC